MGGLTEECMKRPAWKYTPWFDYHISSVNSTLNASISIKLSLIKKCDNSRKVVLQSGIRKLCGNVRQTSRNEKFVSSVNSSAYEIHQMATHPLRFFHYTGMEGR